mmetsp:Transcript_15790/g.26445  ORF Transcript_15790/g.26445 Transcript_15790/m.26445 type:complete len:240 (-) Transcript_15790:87-806(-)
MTTAAAAATGEAVGVSLLLFVVAASATTSTTAAAGELMFFSSASTGLLSSAAAAVSSAGAVSFNMAFLQSSVFKTDLEAALFFGTLPPTDLEAALFRTLSGVGATMTTGFSFASSSAAAALCSSKAPSSNSSSIVSASSNAEEHKLSVGSHVSSLYVQFFQRTRNSGCCSSLPLPFLPLVKRIPTRRSISQKPLVTKTPFFFVSFLVEDGFGFLTDGFVFTTATTDLVLTIRRGRGILV